MAYVRPEFAEDGRELSVKMLNQHDAARVVAESPYDPANERLRMDLAR